MQQASDATAARHRSRRPALLALALAGALVVVGAATAALLSARRAFLASTSDVTDPARYAEVLRTLPQHGCTAADLAHLPPQIPPSASNVRLFYRPHSLQGGTQFELLFTLPDDQIAALEQGLIASAKYAGAGGAPLTDPAGHLGPPQPEFRNGPAGPDDPLPADFRVYVLAAVPEFPGKDGWVSGSSRGTAISHQRHEVAHWLTDW